MKKVIFTKTELHKFLLLGANGEYLINKIYPSVRAIKRKDTLSIFGTVRYNKNITTVKIGSFPKNSIDEIHAKFEIAKRVSLNGHNPNIILNSEVGKYKQIDEKSDKVTMEMVLKYYLNKRIISSKYKLNFFHNVKKNSNYLFSQNIKDFKKSNIELIIETLLKEKKKLQQETS